VLVESSVHRLRRPGADDGGGIVLVASRHSPVDLRTNCATPGSALTQVRCLELDLRLSLRFAMRAHDPLEVPAQDLDWLQPTDFLEQRTFAAPFEYNTDAGAPADVGSVAHVSDRGP